MKNAHHIIVLRVRVDFADSIIQIRCSFLRNRVIYFSIQMMCKYTSLWQASHFWILRQKGKERQTEEEWIRREKEGREKGNDKEREKGREKEKKRGGSRDGGRVLPGVCCLDEIGTSGYLLMNLTHSLGISYQCHLCFTAICLSQKTAEVRSLKEKSFAGGWVKQVRRSTVWWWM